MNYIGTIQVFILSEFVDKYIEIIEKFLVKEVL